MTDHGLKIGAVVDLDISRGGSGGARKIDWRTRGDAGEETAFVPRRLPLGIAPLVNTKKGEVSRATYHIIDALWRDGQNTSKKDDGGERTSHCDKSWPSRGIIAKGACGCILHSGCTAGEELLVETREVSLTPCCRGPVHKVGAWNAVTLPSRSRLRCTRTVINANVAATGSRSPDERGYEWHQWRALKGL